MLMIAERWCFIDSFFCWNEVREAECCDSFSKLSSNVGHIVLNEEEFGIYPTSFY